MELLLGLPNSAVLLAAIVTGTFGLLAAGVRGFWLLRSNQERLFSSQERLAAIQAGKTQIEFLDERQNLVERLVKRNEELRNQLDTLQASLEALRLRVNRVEQDLLLEKGANAPLLQELGQERQLRRQLEARVALLERENGELRLRLGMPPSERPQA